MKETVQDFKIQPFFPRGKVVLVSERADSAPVSAGVWQ
jgi:hypothetical protein